LTTYTKQSQSYAQNITYTIIVTTLVAAAIICVPVFVINRGIHNRHLAIQRALQNEVEKRTGQLQFANNQLLIANEKLMLHDKISVQKFAEIKRELFVNIAGWKVKEIMNIIYEKTSVRYHEVHIYRLLHKWGFSPKVPRKRFVNTVSNNEKKQFKKSK
jgi:transposase